MNVLSKAVLALLIPFAKASAQEPKDLSEIRAILHEASQLLPQLEKWQLSTVSNIPFLQMRAGDLAGAMESAEKIGGLASYVGVYALTDRGDWRAALQLLAALPADIHPSPVYLEITIQLAKRGDFAHAREVAEKLRQEPETYPSFADALLTISTEEWKVGERTASVALLREALETVEHLEPPSNRAPRYAYIANTLAASGAKEEASMVVERLRLAIDQERARAAKPEDFGLLAKSLAAVGNIDEALATARQMSPGLARDTAMIAIALEQAKLGDSAGARALASGTPTESWPDFSLLQFAAALAGAGDTNGAIEVIRALPKGPSRANGFVHVALAQAGKKDPAALVTIDLAIEEALRAHDAVGHIGFDLIAVARAEMGDFSGAMQIIDGLDETYRAWPLRNLTELMVEAQKKNEALALARAEKAPFPRAYALLGVATGMREQLDSAKTKSQLSK